MTRDEQNQQHFLHPEPGDGWHERFVYQFIVLAVLDNTHLVIAPVQQTRDGQRICTEQAYEITREQFRQRTHYPTVSMQDRFMHDVSPGHLRMVEQWRERDKGEYRTLSLQAQEVKVVLCFPGIGAEKAAQSTAHAARKVQYNNAVSVAEAIKVIQSPDPSCCAVLLPYSLELAKALGNLGKPFHVVFPHIDDLDQIARNTPCEQYHALEELLVSCWTQEAGTLHQLYPGHQLRTVLDRFTCL